jgi:hypothetical protein
MRTAKAPVKPQGRRKTLRLKRFGAARISLWKTPHALALAEALHHLLEGPAGRC